MYVAARWLINSSQHGFETSNSRYADADSGVISRRFPYGTNARCFGKPRLDSPWRSRTLALVSIWRGSSNATVRQRERGEFGRH
jgi:hypothetical protein